MTDAPRNAANYCYRHPDRQSFVLCQRCGRTICGECQTPAAVGVHCPECVREARGSAPRVKPAVVTRFRGAAAAGKPVVTYSIMAVTAVVFLLQLLTGVGNGVVTQALVFYAPVEIQQPWRMVTTMFVHGSFWHILFNMYSLYIFGAELERQLGRARYSALYFIAGIGGSAAVAVLAPSSVVLGASGAVFGLMAAFFVIARSLGSRSIQLLVLVAINLALGFILPSVAWQAHVGGLIVGGAVAFLYSKTRHRSKHALQTGVLVALGVAVVAITLLRSAQLIGLL
ncbi:rhomboid family intramembrane serine protease [Frigoribacterium endophyticum]|uniref:rhomboid family intramembrane serine protease n=1 Tax=Frigoribacterium endophyticum TaxID=1522176 RepID=UPI0014235593|nr:membrane associated rhomboid family serine protease [Frigoribacterium endophyticum]